MLSYSYPKESIHRIATRAWRAGVMMGAVCGVSFGIIATLLISK